MEYELTVSEEMSPTKLIVGFIWGENIDPVFSDDMPEFLAPYVKDASWMGDDFWPKGIKARVRDMMRHGKFHPAGRAKPASEFLLKAALDDEFPAICGPVNINNAISLRSGLPISVFDADLTGPELLVRWGYPGESYFFNRAGHEIFVEDLLVVCRKDAYGTWLPCGNPVKDSMATKVRPVTKNVLAVIYAPADYDPDELEKWCAEFAALLKSECHAESVGFRV
jgi:DNA/RNA-binding domain of Phe-tRNA-synthetase-like protein